MRLRTPLLLAVAPLSFSFLHADTIFSNVTAGTPGEGGAIHGTSVEPYDSYLALGLEFTPTTTATFTDALVDLWGVMSSGSDASVTASLYATDGRGNLGALLAQLDTTTAPSFNPDPSLPFSLNATSFTQTSGPAPSLAAGTDYWLLLSPGDGNSFLWIGHNLASAGLFTGIQFSPSSPFDSVTFSGLELEINGTPPISSAPEPSYFAVLGGGLVALLGFRKRKINNSKPVDRPLGRCLITNVG
jgi:hypothetical protein